jgi:hypothetical protein
VYQQLAEVRLESRLKISELRGQLGVAEEKLKKIEVVGIGERSIDMGIVLRDKLRSVASARSLQSELEAPMESEKLTQGLRVAGATLRKGSWVVDAHWYLCTSDDQERKAYKLLCGEGEATVVPVASMVREHGLEFMRESRTDAILKGCSHLALIEHNNSNVAGVARSI